MRISVNLIAEWLLDFSRSLEIEAESCNSPWYLSSCLNLRAGSEQMTAAALSYIATAAHTSEPVVNNDSCSSLWYLSSCLRVQSRYLANDSCSSLWYRNSCLHVRAGSQQMTATALSDIATAAHTSEPVVNNYSCSSLWYLSSCLRVQSRYLANDSCSSLWYRNSCLHVRARSQQWQLHLSLISQQLPTGSEHGI